MNNDNKHAYLIIAHNQFDLLKRLLKSLDDPRNDIYLHIDKKVHNINLEEFKDILKFSNLYFTKHRINVAWGGDSMVKCEMLLLKEAHLKRYSYYHLLSGVDYPIKSQDYIHEFFERNAGKNFVDFENNEVSLRFARDRMEYRHYLQNQIGRNSGKKKQFLEKFEARLIYVQKIFKLSRLKHCKLIIKKGAQWFSISDELVKEILKKEKIIKKYFFNSSCADEMFIMTVAYNSYLKESLICDSLRYVIWEGGKHPKVLGLEDINEILKSEALWARKCSEEYSLDLITRINEIISSI